MEKQRDLLIDLLKIFAIIMVITSHTLNSDLIFDDIAVPLFLVITGFNFFFFWQNKRINYRFYYDKVKFLSNILKFLIPYLFLVLFQVILRSFTNTIKWSDIYQFLFLGGFGDGSYYTPLVIQILIVFPLIYNLIKRFNLKGLFIILLFYLFYEVLINLILNPDNYVVKQLYRYLIFRQVFYIASGCFIFLNKNKVFNYLSFLFVAIGITFYLLYKFSVYQPILFKSWPTTSLPFGLLAIGLVYICTKIFNVKKTIRPLALLSNATFHIFLTQQSFFYINNNVYYFSYYSIWFNLLICISIGILFFIIEQYLTKRIFKKVVTIHDKRSI